MARTTTAKSKTRIICLTDQEEAEITADIGNGSRTAGVRRMLELIKEIARAHGKSDLNSVIREMQAELKD